MRCRDRCRFGRSGFHVATYRLRRRSILLAGSASSWRHPDHDLEARSPITRIGPQRLQQRCSPLENKRRGNDRDGIGIEAGRALSILRYDRGRSKRRTDAGRCPPANRADYVDQPVAGADLRPLRHGSDTGKVIRRSFASKEQVADYIETNRIPFSTSQ